MTELERAELLSVADRWGIQGIICALADWCEPVGGLEFVKKSVGSITQEDVDEERCDLR